MRVVEVRLLVEDAVMPTNVAVVAALTDTFEWVHGAASSDAGDHVVATVPGVTWNGGEDYVDGRSPA